MSLDRYLTLRYPLKYGRNKRRSLMAYKIITIWLISFAICLPLFILGLVDSSNVYDDKTRGCFPVHRTFKIYGSFIAFFIPLTIMIVTYALTMSALQQAHTTKEKRDKRKKKMHAVINIAAMAVRWKRAVNTVEIPDEKKTSEVSEQPNQSLNNKTKRINHQRKRASSLLINEHPKKSIFTSSHRLNESLKPAAPVHWHKRQQNHLRPLSEKSSKESIEIEENIRNSLTKSISCVLIAISSEISVFH
jgi:heme/copper-type cytochrome/quinol oxidase subunit 1